MLLSKHAFAEATPKHTRMTATARELRHAHSALARASHRGDSRPRMSDRLFISSVPKEFAAERRALRDFVRSDPLLRRFFDVILFEDGPATGRLHRRVGPRAESSRAPVDYELPRGRARGHRLAIAHVKPHGRITHAERQKLSGATRKTATRDLADLVAQDVLERKGDRRATSCHLASK